MSKLLKLSWILLAALAVLTTACSKDDEEEESTKEYMSGSVEYSLESYVAKGDMVTMSASGITTPADPVYKWYIPGIQSDSLHARKVTIKFPDSLGVFAVTAIATAPGYYNSSNTISVTTVDTTWNGSLTGLAHSGKSVLDLRDGLSYQYVTIGNLDWFAQNLAWDGAGVAFEYSPITHKIFGRLYSWEEATGGVSATGLGNGPKGACPEGWSIPTTADWEDLAKAVSGRDIPFVNDWDSLAAPLSGNAYFNEERMWPYCPDNDHNNRTGWNAIPVGSSRTDNKGFCGFSGRDSYAFWWSSTEKDGDKAYYRYMYFDRHSFPMNYTYKSGFGASVRCVRLASGL